MSDSLAGQNIVVTGGAGAFGRAFVVRALQAGARRVVVFSRDEAKHAAMRAGLADDRVRYFVGDVRDMDRVRWAFRSADVVVHAAAMKRVDAAAENPFECVATNVDGSSNVARAAVLEGVGKAILLSTDKAASPSTLYGVTKACAEHLWVQSNAYAAGTPTKLSATRYGNVLGSTGSVIPRWAGDVTRHGVLTVTEGTATRFWMTMTDAVALVELALGEMVGGETFVPKLKGASVATLATALYPDTPRRVIGLQDGEKLHETLLSEDEAGRVLDCGSHYVLLPAAFSWGMAAVDGARVPPTFQLRSDTAAKWSEAELRRMAA